MSSPFGIEILAPLASLKIIDDLGGNKYLVEAPKAHPSFVNYIVQATEKLGVVWIKANSNPKPSDAFGAAIREEVDTVASQMPAKYGKSEKQDFIMHGSIWNEPQYWISAVSEGERFYSYMWNSESNAELPIDIESIFVGTLPLGASECGVTVEFASHRMDAAETEANENLSEYF